MNSPRVGKQMFHLRGIPFSSGFARGRAHVYRDILKSKEVAYNIKKDQYDAEYSRINKARETVRRQLFTSAKRAGNALDKNIADIFLAQEIMLEDPQLATDLKQTLHQKHFNAERVVGTVFRRWIRKFRDAPSKMLNERADDIEDLFRRMLGVLSGVEAHRLENLPSHTILVARRLLPSDTVFLSRTSCAGILLEIAGATAHSTILARELGVPCIGKVSGLIANIATGDEVLVDGNAGKITVNPTAQMNKDFDTSRNRFSRQSTIARKNRFKTARTINGKTIKVMANVGSREDIEMAVDSGADGIGLFRTEGFFLAAQTLPSVDEFTRYLLHCLEPAGNRAVNLRLLDIGGDKNLPYLNLPFELNPFLGRRGVRLLFDFPALLRIQLEAAIAVSQQYRIRVLVPMVTFSKELLQIKQMLRTISVRKKTAALPLGAMIETPAAALSVPSLCDHADFLSVGTNDLTQYVMAADRESLLVDDYFLDDHPVLLWLLNNIMQHAGTTPVTLCGELAAKSEALGSVLDTGITALSVAPVRIPAVKEAVRYLKTNTKGAL
ncbi:MAG: phosphoenolpyruvate--protein phosphotransferase [Chitinispirillaceae bacterium]|nr:phosphoenolpyruvate--protein phosphotransferase [Chitinispirillaceae bacterium]